MPNNLLEDIFYIKSQYLKLIEPFMEKYFDYDSSMLLDPIKRIVEAKCPNHITYENGIPTADYLKIFYENEWLTFIDSDYSHKNGLEKEPTYTDLADIFPDYFPLNETQENGYLKDGDVYICLDYMAYIYFKQVNGDFNHSFLVTDLDLEYQSALHNEIYPEMLSLYRMILESKKYKNKGGKITLTNNFHQIDINSHAWFLDDMEKYFKDRFPDLTLEKINELLPKPNKAGRKFNDPYLTVMIWGTYQLMKNHHSAFKDSNVKISKEICLFIIDYLEFLGIEHNYVEAFEIKDILKHHIKHQYIPKWNLPWRNVFSGISEKQPESQFERLNQPSRRYNLSNLL